MSGNYSNLVVLTGLTGANVSADVPLPVTVTTSGVVGTPASILVAGLVTLDGTVLGSTGPNGTPVIQLTTGATIGGVTIPTGTDVYVSNTPYATGASVAITLCLLQGTSIETESGPCAVEALAIGDLVRTASGALRAVTWLGHRHVSDGSALEYVQTPVRVARGAFSDGVPSADLWMSPEHAVFQDGVLVPVRHLANGSSIAHVELDTYTYWHVALETHDVILAEGLAVESLLSDAGNIESFDNAETAASANPFAAPCAPVITQGPRLVAIRERIDARVMQPA